MHASANGQLSTPDVSPIIVAGGTDLYVQKHEEMNHAGIQFVLDDPKLKGITQEGTKCIIGSAATVTDLKNSSLFNTAFPSFPQYAKLISSTPIRNMATIAGNFINASPIGDLTIFFLALDAEIVLGNNITSKEKNLRSLALKKLYRGYKQLDKAPEEILHTISFELPGNNSLFNFEKVSKRTNLDIASVNSAICITMNKEVIERAGLSAGGVGPVPMYLEKLLCSWLVKK